MRKQCPKGQRGNKKPSKPCPRCQKGIIGKINASLNMINTTKQFDLTSPKAQNVVNTCSQYQQTLSLPQILDTNPQKLKPNNIWQTNVTHVSNFGTFKYVHVSINTFSRFIVTTAHKSEKSRNATGH